MHLSAGDLLRAERNRPESELAPMIEEHIKLGKIIPVAITCSLIERAMNEHMQVRALERVGIFQPFSLPLFSCATAVVHRNNLKQQCSLFYLGGC